MAEFKPNLVKIDELYGEKGYTLRQIKPNIFQFDSGKLGSHVYLVLGDHLNILIDSGIVSKFNSLTHLLTTEIGIKVEDINLIINTHEHFDHVSNNCFFKCMIAAHRAAATKIKNSDELITKAKIWSVDLTDFHIDIWMEDRTVFDLGSIVLNVIHTPGHTSGSICLYEAGKGLLFTGDTVFRGAMPNIYESGSIAELINSLHILQALKVRNFFPGHGSCVFETSEVESELSNALLQAKRSLKDYISHISSKPLDRARPPPSLYDREPTA
ncbi:MAG: MBL fold metallo-hydrolase [Candidatus Lokiarchaeota archaeon]|nr:MBL fold metallo-hydrolase [Candidatus Lokiarchaeota archaeon]